MGKGVFYETIHKASSSLPYLDFCMENINYFSHFHEELEVLFVSEGNTKLTVDTNCYSMESGDIAAVMPGEIHSLSTPVHSRMYIMKFLPAGSAGNDALSRIRLHKRVISSTDEAYPAFRKQIERIYLEASERKPGFAFAVQAAFLEIITLFLRTEGHTVITLAEKDRLNSRLQLLQTVNSYIEENYTHEIPLAEIAAHCKYSVSYFAHYFREISNLSFGEYLIRFRLEKATGRMLLTGETLTCIALSCGFNTVRSFNRMFKKHLGITPSEYRGCHRTAASHEQ